MENLEQKMNRPNPDKPDATSIELILHCSPIGTAEKTLNEFGLNTPELREAYFNALTQGLTDPAEIAKYINKHVS